MVGEQIDSGCRVITLRRGYNSLQQFVMLFSVGLIHLTYRVQQGSALLSAFERWAGLLLRLHSRTRPNTELLIWTYL